MPTIDEKEKPFDPTPWIVAGCLAGAVVVAAYVSSLLYKRSQTTSRRLVGALEGTLADKGDLPPNLRSKYRAQKVIGSGGSGVVLEAWQIATLSRDQGTRESVTAWCAIKLVHCQSRRLPFSDSEVRRLDREVYIYIYIYIYR
jgi:hypothetical protein